MDDYIRDRFLQYNNKKYPENYDKLCENYMREKLEIRRVEERKIAALRDVIGKDCSEERTVKINSIIKLYQGKICLLYTSDAADDMQCVDLGGRRIIKKA